MPCLPVKSDVLLCQHLCQCRHARKEERLQQMRNELADQQAEEITLVPSINPASRHMALRLAQRAAQQDPQLLTVIQSQPEGWVLGLRPASPRRHPPASGLPLHLPAESLEFVLSYLDVAWSSSTFAAYSSCVQ